MSQALDFLRKKELMEKEKELDKIYEFKKNNAVTVHPDSKRNTEEHIAKYKQNSMDRNENIIRSAYHDLIITKAGVKYRVHQLTSIKAKQHGYSFKCYPLNSDSASFIIMETQLKRNISMGYITIEKDKT